MGPAVSQALQQRRIQSQSLACQAIQVVEIHASPGSQPTLVIRVDLYPHPRQGQVHSMRIQACLHFIRRKVLVLSSTDERASHGTDQRWPILKSIPHKANLPLVNDVGGEIELKSLRMHPHPGLCRIIKDRI